MKAAVGLAKKTTAAAATSCGWPRRGMHWRAICAATGVRVGAGYCVVSRDLDVLMQEATEPVSSSDLDIGVDRIG